MKGTLGPEDYTRIGQRLKQAFWENDELPEYSIIDSTISAALRGTDDPSLSSFYALALPSSVFRAARDSFYSRGRANGERALVLLRKLMEVEPDHRDGMKLLFKLQVRFGQYSEARNTLRRIKELGRPEALPLQGYLHWKEGRFKQAIASYQAAIAAGQRAVEIYHGLAMCLFLEKRVDEAKAQIKEGLGRRSRRNGLLVDLAAKIAIATHDYSEAVKYVDQLRQLNAMDDFNHRAATLYSATGQPSKALIYAREAVQSPNSRFETEAVLIKVLIDLNELPEAAERLEQFERQETAAGGRRDVRLGLRCKLLLRQGDWRAAEAIWQQLGEKDGLIQQGLRKDIVLEKIKDSSVKGSERQSATLELESLAAKQTGDQFDLSFEEEIDSPENEADTNIE
jgi:tetratricopeptide (TPR) repeat protein